MKVQSLQIMNLRNVAEVSLELSPDMNVFVGDNGAGKTTLLESLVILAKGKSFRSGTTASLLGPRGERYLVRASITDDAGKSHTAAVQRDRSGWEGRLDGEPLKQLSDTAEWFPIILMEPTTHQLVSGSPDVRRRYLDWTVFHVKHEFLTVWRRYSRALKQRNAALRQRDSRMVESMDPQLVMLGEQLQEQRTAVFALLKPELEQMLAEMSPELGRLETSLNPGWTSGTLQEALNTAMSRDLEQGMTRYGPHRADISLKVNGKSVRDRLSRGEQKVLAAAMCLAQGAVFRNHNRTPILLLDDLASEFDQDHLTQVVTAGKGLEAQLFITGTDQSPYKGFKDDGMQVFHVKHGEI